MYDLRLSAYKLSSKGSVASVIYQPLAVLSKLSIVSLMYNNLKMKVNFPGTVPGKPPKLMPVNQTCYIAIVY